MVELQSARIAFVLMHLSRLAVKAIRGESLVDLRVVLDHVVCGFRRELGLAGVAKVYHFLPVDVVPEPRRNGIGLGDAVVSQSCAIAVQALVVVMVHGFQRNFSVC